MSYSLDVELFINEIKKRPEIWDPDCEDNRYKKRKQQAWADVAQLFIEDFDGMAEVDKLDVYRKLHGKWRNIRDSFVRFTKRPEGKKGYMYAKHLSFLNKIYKTTSGSEAEVENDSNSNHHWESDDDRRVKRNKRVRVLNDSISNWSDEDPPSTIDNLKRKRVPNVKTEEVEFVEPPFPDNSFSAEDDDRSFFESLLPAVREFNLDQKLEFRSQVLAMVKNIRYGAHVVEIQPSSNS